jgi:hypothetical protein
MVSGEVLPPPANKIVADFVSRVTTFDQLKVEGIYITGSLALDDFFPDKSDIDFIVVCKKFPDISTVSHLKRIHKTIAAEHTGPHLSGSYISYRSIMTAKPEDTRSWNYHNGRWLYGPFELAPITIKELTSHAVTVFGPKAEDLGLSMERESLRHFLYQNLNSYWKAWADRHAAFTKRKIFLLLLPQLTEWSLLGVARQLYTLRTGKITSKSEAGTFCLEHLPEKFHPIIREAIAIRQSSKRSPMINSYTVRPSFRRLRQTLECVHFMIREFNKDYLAG